MNKMIPKAVEASLTENGIAATNIVPAQSGTNSEAFKIYSKDKTYYLKRFREVAGLSPSRAARELDFLDFMAVSSHQYIPKYIYGDRSRFTLYEFYETRTLNKSDIESMVEEFVYFIGSVVKSSELQGLPGYPAVDAYFSLTSLYTDVTSRLRILCRSLQDVDVIRHLEELIAKFQMHVDSDHFSELERQWCDLPLIYSPSDLSDKNVLVGDFGLKFIDFEYSGTDSLGKLLFDFLKNPFSEMATRDRTRVIKVCCERFSVDIRIFHGKLLNTIFEIKWCLIAINKANDSRAKRQYLERLIQRSSALGRLT